MLHLSLLQTFTVAGLCSGLLEGLFINPFEVIKVKLQAERSHVAEVRIVVTSIIAAFC